MGKVADVKITLQRVESGEEEIIIRYREMTPEITSMVERLSGSGARLSGIRESEGEGRQVCYFDPGGAYYFESVDGMVYAYLEKEVFRIREKLEEIICRYGGLGIARCSRTMALNLYRVQYLQSQPGGRILAILQNGEKIVISRRYAGALREKLRRGAGGHEESGS